MGEESAAAPTRLLDCPTCGLAQSLGSLPAGARAHCARCNTVIAHGAAGEGAQRAFCFALTALLLFPLAYRYPILEVTTFGDARTYTVLSGARALWQSAMWPLAVPVALASVALPFCLIVSLLALTLARPAGMAAVHWLRRICGFLATWSIVDVYLLAIFVTVVKLAQMTDAAPAGGALLFLGLVVALALALRSLDLDRPHVDQAELRTDGARGPWPRPPSPESLNRTLALTLAALILFIPANVFPTLTVVLMGSTQTDTVFDGVVALWQAGMWPLALIVMCASLVIPLVKIVVLLFLVLSIGMRTRRLERTRVYRFIEGIGRWSMLDVYVISLIVAVINLGALSGARADIGALAFAAVVIATIAATRQFDPRLIWRGDDRV
ncbi:MAG: paraquat-inducible protein A [Geminicoccaceae bacterium]